jgi:hypothetical protein
MQQLIATPLQVLPTTKVESAEHRLARDLMELAAVVHAARPAMDVRGVEAHVAVDERRVRSLRALPCHRCGRDAADVRRTLAAAYDDLAAAYARAGQAARRAWAAGRAAQERDGLGLTD